MPGPVLGLEVKGGPAERGIQAEQLDSAAGLVVFTIVKSLSSIQSSSFFLLNVALVHSTYAGSLVDIY